MSDRGKYSRKIAAALAIAGAAGLLYWLPTLDLLLAAVAWIRGAGFVGFAVFLVVYLAATLLIAPASWLQAAAGYLYGPWVGIPLAWVASNLSGLVAFRLARTTLRGWVTRRLARFPLHRAMEHAVGEDGAALVALLRLSPLSPYNPLCYALGLTRVRTARYALGTAVGSIAPQALYAFLGSTVNDLQEVASGEAASEAAWFSAAALVLTVVATVAVSWIARQALKRALATDSAAQVGAAEPASS